MTLSVSHIVSQYENLSNPTLVFDFPIKAETDLEVLFYDSNNAVWSELVLNVDYTVAATLDSITLIDPETRYGAFNRLVIKRARPYLQQTTYVTGDKFPAKATEGALDDLEMQIQQLASQGARSLRTPDFEPAIDPLPTASVRAEKYLAFDSSGNLLLSAGDVSALRSVFRQEVVATSGQTIFQTDYPYVPGANNLLVFVNGIAKIPGVDYYETNGNTITFLSGLAPGFKVTMLFGLILDARTTLYYIRALNGTQIKNGQGTLTLEARRIQDGQDSLLTEGSIQLYVGITLATEGNGFVAGSNGYTSEFDAGDINGLVVVELKDGPYGAVLYSVSLADIFDGADTALYYIKPISGTAIKNGLGSLTVEAHQLVNGVDTHLSTGAVQLYVGNTLVSQANGYAAGSNGYTGVFDSGDINGAVVVTLKNGAGGTPLDTITLVDVIDGTVGGPGTDAVYGYIEVNGSLGHTRANDQVTWDPVDATTQLDCTFVQAGAPVARAAWLITRAANGVFTGASITHKDGDLNGSRITINELNEGTKAFTVKFDYAFSGDESSVAETLISSLAGAAGTPGAAASLYYIKPINGTAIKNGVGILQIEAHRLVGGVDSLLNSGTVKLYVGTTEVTQANGFGVGSNGFTGYFDAGDINGSTVVVLKDGAAGTPLDTITLVDVDDGLNGFDGVFGYINASAPLAWTRGNDQSTWTPVGTTARLDATFVQGAVEIARVAYLVTRDANGLLTAAAADHAGGNLNPLRVAVALTGSGTQVLSIKFTYSFGGFSFVVEETLYTSMAGAPGSPGTGTPGTPALSLRLTKRALQIMGYQNGGLVAASLASANGALSVWSGETDVTAAATINAAFAVGCTGTINQTVNSPVNGQPKGYYQVTAMSADSATLQLQAIYNGVTITELVTVTRVPVGYEIVTSLPSTNLFHGRMVFLNGDGKLYRYSTLINPATGQIYGWTREVDGVDLKANSVTTNSIIAGAITAAKIAVSTLSSIAANIGEIVAGILRSAGATYEASNFRINLNTSRIVHDTNPGATGGRVKISGIGFGPSSQYVEWYGDKPPGQSTEAGIVANLTDSNARSFQKTDGAALFAGRLRGEFEPKVWCNANCDTTPPTIRDRFNISSVTRVVSGRHRFTFAEPLANANYACVVGVFDTGNQVLAMVYEQTTTYVEIRTTQRNDGGALNPTRINILIFGSNVIGGSNNETPTGGAGGGTVGWGNTPGSVLP